MPASAQVLITTCSCASQRADSPSEASFSRDGEKYCGRLGSLLL
jgi:hypothetical protein